MVAACTSGIRLSNDRFIRGLNICAPDFEHEKPQIISPPNYPLYIYIRYKDHASSNNYIHAVRKADMLLDLNQSLVQLRKVQNKWREIGLGLRVPETHIEQVEPYCANNDTLGMTEMIDFWMRNCTGQPTWRELANVLQSVREEQLAKQLMDIYETGKLELETNAIYNYSYMYNYRFASY